MLNRLMGILLFILIVSENLGCHKGSSESDFEEYEYVTVKFSASDRYNADRVIFWMHFSTLNNTAYPHGRELSISLNEAPHYFYEPLGTNLNYEKILPNVGRGAGWWMTSDEIRKWLKPGRNKLIINFGKVRSNPLYVDIPEKGPISFYPEYVNPDWRMIR